VLGGWEPDPQTDHHIRAPARDSASRLLAGVAVVDAERIALARPCALTAPGTSRHAT